jgi:Icc-related predicted phosphoesterase
MRIVATSDTHHVVKKGWIPDGDVFIHAGDLMRTGYPDDFARQLEWLRELPHNVKLFVPGNHDFHLQVYPGPALQQLRDAGVWVIGLPGNDSYATYTLENGMTVLGLPYVVNLPRWAFNSTEPEIKKHLQKMGKHDIVVSHTPPYSFGDNINGESRGIVEYRRYAVIHRPKHWISGHIHEGYGSRKNDFGTEFHNVAMCNRNYEHANSPMVIDL